MKQVDFFRKILNTLDYNAKKEDYIESNYVGREYFNESQSNFVILFINKGN